MAKAIAYYRTRPSEPEASDPALRPQRDAVGRPLEGGGFESLGESTERECECGDETDPAYAAAVQAAVAHVEDDGVSVSLVVASQAAIGSGGPFREPRMREQPRSTTRSTSRWFRLHPKSRCPRAPPGRCASTPIAVPASSTRSSVSATPGRTPWPRYRSRPTPST